MNTADHDHPSLFARPAAASNQADEHPTEHPTGTTDGTTIDLTALDPVRPVRPKHPASGSRRSLWLATRPVVTESTRPLPPGLFSLSTRSR